MGFGDVTVNKKMKEFNKILYDILLKLDLNSKENSSFSINENLVKDYFTLFKTTRNKEFLKFIEYFNAFFYFCFELPLDYMLEDILKFKY